MGSYRDTYYEEVDEIFGSVRINPMNDEFPDEHAVPQETKQPLGPAGWVENASGVTGNATVVINADGIKVTGGSIQVVNASGTVIIDGSSNMFKIIATGTLQAPAGSGLQTAFTDITTNYGATNTPIYLGFNVNLTTYFANKMPIVETNAASPASINALHEMFTHPQSATVTRLVVWKNSFAGSLAAYDYRYYMLKEAAI